MFKRKLLTSFITSILSIIILSFLNPIDSLYLEQAAYWEKLLPNSLMFSIYVVPCVFLYGLPTSLLVGTVTNKMEAGQFQFSIIGHVFFGILPFFILWFFTFYSVVIAFLFCVVDHIIQFKRN